MPSVRGRRGDSATEKKGASALCMHSPHHGTVEATRPDHSRRRRRGGHELLDIELREDVSEQRIRPGVDRDRAQRARPPARSDKRRREDRLAEQVQAGRVALGLDDQNVSAVECWHVAGPPLLEWPVGEDYRIHGTPVTGRALLDDPILSDQGPTEGAPAGPCHLRFAAAPVSRRGGNITGGSAGRATFRHVRHGSGFPQRPTQSPTPSAGPKLSEVMRRGAAQRKRSAAWKGRGAVAPLPPRVTRAAGPRGARPRRAAPSGRRSAAAHPPRRRRHSHRRRAPRAPPTAVARAPPPSRRR